MKIKFEREYQDCDYLALPVAGTDWQGSGSGLNGDHRQALRDAADRLEFDGKPGTHVELTALSGLPKRTALFGVAADKELSSVESYGAGVLKAAASHHAAAVRIESGALDPIAIAGGALLASYRFDEFKEAWLSSRPKKRFSVETLTIVCPDPDKAQQDWIARSAIYESINWVRNLINSPPNMLTPDGFAKACLALEEIGIEVCVLDEAEMERLGMRALLGVGQGSRQQSRLVSLTWRGAGDAPFTAFVGKGVTFDTGGLSIKPALSMEDMKCDMGGAAAVAGALRTIASRKARANVVGVLALAENMPDGNAQRPSDIVTSMSGQTIEIINTDAEGRLVLADALTWVQKNYHPAKIVDLATLTGAMIISLGHLHAGLFSNDDALSEALQLAGNDTGETLWRMPLNPAYDKLMDSDFADMKNAYVKNSGAITAAQFLQRFVEPGVAWAHLDIAGVATRPLGDDPRYPVWATGWGPKLLDRFIAAQESE
jgi:leucyl aminopeptidase